VTDLPRTIVLGERSRHLKVEAPGVLVHIEPGHRDARGRQVTYVSVSADGDRYAGDPAWWVSGRKGSRGRGFRIVQMTK